MKTLFSASIEHHETKLFEAIFTQTTGIDKIIDSLKDNSL